MTTITLKINKKTKTGKALLDLVNILSSDKQSIEIVSKQEEKISYNANFVRMVKSAADSKQRIEINPKNVWESLGLD